MATRSGSTSGTEARPRGRALQALAALVLVAIAAVVVLVPGSDRATLHVRFQSAGGLVKGGDARIGGRGVGKITRIELTDDAQADVELSLDAEDAKVLTAASRATIRAVGQAGVTNHYVDLTPGPPGTTPLEDGAVLPAVQTRGYVALDAVLSSLDKPARTSIQRLVAGSADIYAGSGARSFNDMLGKLSPALREVNGLAGQVASDEADLQRLIVRSAQASTAVASRRPDLRAAVANTARTFTALAAERERLGDVFTRAPGVLRQAQGTLGRGSTAVDALRPALRAVPPAAAPLATVLGDLPPSLRRFTPALRKLNRQLPDVQRALKGFVPLETPAVKALTATGTALQRSQPILAGLRIYGSDFILGIFNGLIGISTAPYDNGGHYVHLEFTQSPQQLLAGAASSFLSSQPLLPGLIDLKFGQDARCPGSNAPPAPDGSSPWVPDPSLCDPSQNTPASVNEP